MNPLVWNGICQNDNVFFECEWKQPYEIREVGLDQMIVIMVKMSSEIRIALK